MTTHPLLERVAAERAASAKEVAAAVLAARTIVLTTHVNADGDGVGSEIALVHLLKALGIPQGRFKLIIHNGLHCREDKVLSDGDQVSIFPPIAGG